MTIHENLLGGPPPTHLPDDPEPRELLAKGTSPAEVAARYPASSLAWAQLADDAFERGRPWSRTRTPVRATTADWTPCAAAAGRATVRSPGRRVLHVIVHSVPPLPESGGTFRLSLGDGYRFSSAYASALLS